MGRIGWAVAAMLGVVLIGGAVVVVAALLREPPPVPAGSLERPAPGEVRPDYLADGTPVWVVAHENGDVRVLSGFATHTPAFLGSMLWWCETAAAFEEPAYASRYDAGGYKIGGPAATGLPAYEVTVIGSTVEVGELGPAPPPDSSHSGAPEVDRDWCSLPDDPAAITVHTFEGWALHESPTDAVASASDGWILLAGEFAVDGNDVFLCAIGDCTDAVLAVGIRADNPRGQFSPLVGQRFIARVRDGALVDLTRVLPVDR